MVSHYTFNSASRALRAQATARRAIAPTPPAQKGASQPKRERRHARPSNAGIEDAMEQEREGERGREIKGEEEGEGEEGQPLIMMSTMEYLQRRGTRARRRTGS